MEATQSKTPAQAALHALFERAVNGETVSPQQLADAKTALELETFVEAARETAREDEAAKERAARIEALGAALDEFENEATLEAMRARLRADLGKFARACSEHEARRLTLGDEVGSVPFIQGDERAPALQLQFAGLPKARPQNSIFEAAKDALGEFFPRLGLVELKPFAD
jgi:hypothetical protein